MLAGAISEGEVAPILIAMQKQQEFVFGGFSSGIVTAFRNTLHRKRVVGGMSELENIADLNELPGTIGIAHSRTDDGGGIEWAQPRIDTVQRLASIGNGFGGVLVDSSATTLAANQLLKTGVQFRTRTTTPKLNAVELSDGTFVHCGEVFLEAVAAHHADVGSFEGAVRAVNLRTESAGIYLADREDDVLYIVNHNQSLVAAKTTVGMQVATSRLAVVGSTFWELEIGPNSFATVSKEEVVVRPLWNNEGRYDFAVPASVEDVFLSYLKVHPGSSWAEVTNNSVYPVFPKGKATLAAVVSHRILERLLKEGVIKYEVMEKTGREGQLARQMSLFLTDSKGVHE